jgi:Tfp pilus assembly protein PilF
MRRAAWTLLTATAAGCAAPHAIRSSEPAVVVARGAEPEAAEADHFTRAAECLDRGDDAGAVTHLTAHVKAYPDAVMIRAHLAELHFKLGEAGKAQPHFARFVRDAAGMSGAAGRHLVHGHTRLMEIAAAGDDAFAEQFHRAVGLVLLVRQWDAEPATDGTPKAELDALTETTLVRAAGSLKIAKELAPADPRVHLYLAEVWGRLGQHSAARAAMTTAEQLLPDADLNADERARLRAGRD